MEIWSGEYIFHPFLSGEGTVWIFQIATLRKAKARYSKMYLREMIFDVELIRAVVLLFNLPVQSV